MVDALPRDPADYPQLRVGDQGIKRKRWYVEGYERFDERGALLRCDPKGIEIRTRIHPTSRRRWPRWRATSRCSPRAARPARPAAGRDRLQPDPLRLLRRPPLNAWERAHRQDSPEERTAHLHMTTYGPDLNLSCAALGPAELVDVGRKLTHYSPWLVPLSFSSPFRDGHRLGRAVRAHRDPHRGPPGRAGLPGRRPAAGRADPSLTQVARIPAEVGRIEFKAFDSCPDPTLYGELLSLLTGLVLDRTLPGPARPPRTPPRTGAWPGSGWPTTRCTPAPASCSTPRPPRWPAGTPTWPGWPTLRGRWERRECPATAMLGRRTARGSRSVDCRRRRDADQV